MSTRTGEVQHSAKQPQDVVREHRIHGLGKGIHQESLVIVLAATSAPAGIPETHITAA